MSDRKNALKQEFPYRIELHTHSFPVSGCSRLSPEEIAENYANLGYDAVVLTNHFVYRGDDKETYLDYFMQDYDAFAESAARVGLLPILAAEIRFTENVNDYLVYGVDRSILSEIYDYLPYGVENFRKNYDLKDALFIQAHPFRDHIHVLAPELLDGIEAVNLHPNHNSRNGQALKYAEEHNIPIITAGSDYHYPNMNQEGTTALRSRILPQDGFALAQVLRSGDYILEVGLHSLLIP